MVGQRTPLEGNWWGEGLGGTFKRGFIHGRGRGTAKGISRSKSGEAVFCDCEDFSSARSDFRLFTWKTEYMRWD